MIDIFADMMLPLAFHCHDARRLFAAMIRRFDADTPRLLPPPFY